MDLQTHFASKSRLKSSLPIGIVIAAVSGAAASAQPVVLPEIVTYANLVPTDLSRVGSAVTVITGDYLRQQEIPTAAAGLGHDDAGHLTQRVGCPASSWPRPAAAARSPP